MPEPLTYQQAGVDIATADAAKLGMAKSLETADARVLNRLGAFASLFDASFPGMREPVLVLKTEEPGSKQLLAFEHGRVRSICFDMINHLVNDIAVMGATPLSVQDAIICGRLDKTVVNGIVDAIAEACREQGCVLTGGETSEQPGVLPPGRYILTSSVVGVVDKSKIVDGSRIRPGDAVLAVESSGVHTNGYSLIRALLAQKPHLADTLVGDQTFLNAILTPHRCYFQALRELFDRPELHGMAHITGGGIAGNLARVLPSKLEAVIELPRMRVLPVFSFIRREGEVPEADMLRTFNLGVGMTLVVDLAAVDGITQHLAQHGCPCYPIGEIVPGERRVRFTGSLPA